MYGKLIGVGVGPGDPELLTLKAIRLIQNAPVLAYTVDTKGNSYARKTVAAYIRAEQVELPLLFSMFPQRSERLKTRQAAAEKILDVLRSGVNAVFITEGDPLLYSTFQHLLAEIPVEVKVEVCPGISAMASASAAACFPLAIEGQRLMVAPAETAIGHLQEWLRQGSNVVLYKAGRRVDRIVEEVKLSSLHCETVLVEQASTDAELIYRRLEDWPGCESPYFSIVLLRPMDAQGMIK